ncbi:MAG TPA: DnaA/Hda family protein, partial [Candidatus Omnitrophota bacterium]|nr:DnaA/Hda family protein [Candidatus Omnitrophota bacterium]
MDLSKNSVSNPSQSSDLQDLWSRITAILSKELSERSYKTWFDNVSLLRVEGNTLTLTVPDSYYGKWLEDHYQNLILAAAAEVLGRQVTLSYKVVSPQNSVSLNLPAKDKPHNLPSLNSNYTFDNFVIGPGNRFAHAASLAITDAPAKQYNPLFIYGPTGLG